MKIPAGGGDIYPGKHTPLVDRSTFQLCRDLLKGKNRRTRRQTHTLANGLFLCQHCGSMITGERIRRKLKGGGVRQHTYYRCADNKPADDHPTVRWRERRRGLARFKDGRQAADSQSDIFEPEFERRNSLPGKEEAVQFSR